MEHLLIEEPFNCPASTVWAIIGVLDRVDWVPGIQTAEMRGSLRHMTMDNDQSLVEEIFHHDNAAMEINYGVVESAVGITHHRAHIRLANSDDGQRCTLHWTLEIEPHAFKNAIEQMMRVSLIEIHRIAADA